MSIKVKNREKGASYGAYLAYYIDDVIEKSVFVNALEAGAVVVFTYRWTPGGMP